MVRPLRLLLVLLPLAACVTEPEPELGEVAQDITSPNGTSLNGTSVNGISINGTSVNGTSVNGTSVNGTSVNGTSINGTSVNGTTLRGVDFIGATMVGELATGAKLSMRIDDIYPLAAPYDDVLVHEVEYQTTTGWQPLCGRDATGAAVGAVPLAGRWDATGKWVDDKTLFTWGCRGFALAKCVELGYRPWRSVNGVSMRNHHQSCTRMLRADYCGDGTSNTTNGRLINLFDNLGVQKDTENGLTWIFEAEWGPQGARCILLSRILLNRLNPLPQCASLKLNLLCGLTGFPQSTLLKSEYKLL